jgi:hypothetical protein
MVNIAVCLSGPPGGSADGGDARKRAGPRQADQRHERCTGRDTSIGVLESTPQA